MLQSTWIALMMGFWSALYLLDVFLKSQRSSRRKYIQLLEKTGLSTSICQIRWYTTLFNRLFIRLGQWKPRLLKTWFTFGVLFSAIAMVLSVFVLSLLVFNTLRQQPIEQQVLTPVMPGVNLPSSQVTYYLLTLLICGILHEMGHAVAAVREQVRVNGFGLFVLLMYPGAYVDLSTEHLQAISPIRQLRIYCAGVWHNFIIVLIGLLILFLMPWFLMPFYNTGDAVAITYVEQNSAVSGPRGLAVGDPLSSINGCRVTNTDDWYTCIAVSMKEPATGHCLSMEVITDLDTSMDNFIRGEESLDCCNVTSSTHLCFQYHTKTSSDLKYACLPARFTTDRPFCNYQSDCHTPKVETACVFPTVDNTTKLLRIIHGRKPPLLFLGHPYDLHYSVQVSNYVPSNMLVPVSLPYVIETFSKYLISLSGALIILNVIPCYALDGQWICQGFIEILCRSTIPNRETRGLIYTVLVLLGTLLLFLNVVIAMWTLFLS